VSVFHAWPDAPDILVGAVRPHGLVSQPGELDVALVIYAPHAGAAASMALGAAKGFAPDSATPADGVFDAVPPEYGLMLLRALDGWLLTGIADQEAWLAFSMAFLRRRLYHEYTPATLWRAPAVYELATLVLGTHRAEDAAGTARLYGIAALAPPGWLDEVQLAGGHGNTAEDTPSARAAHAIHYATVLHDDGGLQRLTSGGELNRWLRARLAPG
jgi:hypothetical protein